MKIALIGYGKMGREVERVAIAAGDSIVAKFDIDALPSAERLGAADVCIDFSIPDCVLDNMRIAADAGVDIVVGTTGWYERLPEVREWFKDSALLYGQNFSIVVNVFYRIVRQAARLMNALPDYDVFVEEQHHRNKIDSPSGTALRLGEILLEQIDRKKKWITSFERDRAIAPEALQISSVRAGTIAGAHSVSFDSEADAIELRHVAKSRTGFALGALAAARWVRGRKGVFTMDDVDL